ncbi:MAG: 3-isopropylmalate dehydratase small subunit [Candidatus Eutrophobiaceae bacterium]
MRSFVSFTGKVLPFDRANVDTDAIIPKQYLKSIKRTGFGDYLFDDLRYLDPGDLGTDLALRRPNPDFILNHPERAGAKVLLARRNFGCGSSREYAVWALLDYGIQAVIAPSYGDIFFSNASKNGLLLVELPEGEMDELFAASADSQWRLGVDLEAQNMHGTDGRDWQFKIDLQLKKRLLEGLDDIALTLQHSKEIRQYEQVRRMRAPWLFNGS